MNLKNNLFTFIGFGLLLCYNLKADDKSNFILIMVDDIGCNSIGCYGNDVVRMSNINQLAKERLQYTNAFLISSSCSPKLCSMISCSFSEGLPMNVEEMDLNNIYRKTDEVYMNFLANPEPEDVKTNCSFCVSGKLPELWNLENGEINELSEYEVFNGFVSVPLHLEPLQSRSVVSLNAKSADISKSRNFPEYLLAQEINSCWEVSFDQRWRGSAKLITFDTFQDWSKHDDLGICYYSGTATYKKTFKLSSSQISQSTSTFLNSGKIENMAQVRMNGKGYGIAWKPSYRINITYTFQTGENKLEIDVVNLWINRETLKKCPEWVLNNKFYSSGPYTFTTAKYYEKDDSVVPSGILVPVRISEFV